MSALVLDAGSLVAVDRSDRAMLARLRAAERKGYDVFNASPLRHPSVVPSNGLVVTCSLACAHHHFS
jgi:hypothetical protein